MLKNLQIFYSFIYFYLNDAHINLYVSNIIVYKCLYIYVHKMLLGKRKSIKNFSLIIFNSLKSQNIV